MVVVGGRWEVGGPWGYLWGASGWFLGEPFGGFKMILGVFVSYEIIYHCQAAKRCGISGRKGLVCYDATDKEMLCRRVLLNHAGKSKSRHVFGDIGHRLPYEVLALLDKIDPFTAGWDTSPSSEQMDLYLDALRCLLTSRADAFSDDAVSHCYVHGQKCRCYPQKSNRHKGYVEVEADGEDFDHAAPSTTTTSGPSGTGATSTATSTDTGSDSDTSSLSECDRDDAPTAKRRKTFDRAMCHYRLRIAVAGNWLGQM